MAAEWVDEPQLAALMLREAWRRLHRLRRLVHPLRFWRSGPERLLAVPTGLRRGDPAIAEALYFGRFAFAGHAVEVGTNSPFAVKDAPAAWAAELHAFDWLRHFAADGEALACSSARALVAEWLRLPRRAMPAAASDPGVSARRLLAWITYSRTVLGGADPAFRRRFLRRLAAEARTLKILAATVAGGASPRIRIRIALALAALALPGERSHLKVAVRHLGDELDRQVFPDGGHLSRNPAAIVAILADLLPLRQAFADESQPLSRAIFSAVDRMLPALRFLRHADGSLALFNGCGATDAALVAALLEHDETLGEPVSHLRQSGYQRLAQAATVVIADTGPPPAAELSGDAHAGTLGFEFSSGRGRIVVNCGAPAGAGDDRRRLARSTAAHSTLTVADQSSSRLARSGALDRFLGGPLLERPTRVPLVREDDEAGQRLTAAHDGYRGAFGLVHERSLFLSRNGRRIEGSDRLFEAPGRLGRPAEEREPDACLRFHLHPDVQAERAGTGIRLFAKGDIWWFFADAPASVEDSIFFAAEGGARRTFQIVVGFDRLRRNEVSWRFERHSL